MGKSNKKVKSDRINALRKQYDAFVEEDKKRKERNEYILGRLDKMRFCTTVAPVRRTIIPPITPPAAYLEHQTKMAMNLNFQPSVMPKSQLLLDIPKAEDNYLSEISKNYILIPKLRSAFMNNYLQPAPLQHNANNADNIQHLHEMQQNNTLNTANVIPKSNENNDWKNKYEILNKLKNEEVGNQNVNFATNSAPPSMMLNNEMRFQNINEKTTRNGLEAIPISKSTFEYKYTDDLPEKDIPFENSNHIIKDDGGKVLNAEDDVINDIHCKLQKTNLESNVNEVSNIAMSETNRNDAEQEYNLQSTVPQALGDQENEHAAAQAYSTESNVPQLLEEHTDYVEYATAQAYSTDTNVPQSLEEQDTHYVEYATEQEYNADSTIPQTLEEQNNYVTYPETVNDATLMPNLKCAEENVNTNGYENTVDSVNLAGYKSEEHVQIHSNESISEINSSQAVLEPTSNDYIQYEAENAQVEGLNHQLQGTVADNSEWNALEAEQGHFGAVHQQQSYDNVTNQQQQPQFLDEVQQPHSTNQGMPNQQMPENATETITENQTQVYNAEDIQAFDAEQREMFYSENAAQENVQNFDDNQEYQQEMPYQENQDYNYENNQSYNQISLGEDIEQTLRYDPAYSQQYIDPYEKAYTKQKEIPNESYQQKDLEQPQQTVQETIKTPVDSKGKIKKQEESKTQGSEKD